MTFVTNTMAIAATHEPVVAATPTLPGYSVPNIDQVTQSAHVYSILVTVSLVLYIHMRRYYPQVVAPRIKPDTMINRKTLYETYFGWLDEVWNISDAELVRRTSMDCFLVILFLRFAVRLLVAHGIVGLLVLLPIYTLQDPPAHCIPFCANTQFNNSTDSDQPDSSYLGECACRLIDRYSIANVAPGSVLLWAPVFVAAYFSTVTLWMLYKEFERVIQVKEGYWHDRPPKMYSVFVDSLPSDLQSTRALFNYFEAMFPGRVHGVQRVCERQGQVAELHTIAEQRMRIIALLERTLALEKRRKMTVYHWTFGPSCLRVPSVDTYQEYLSHLNQKYSALCQLTKPADAHRITDDRGFADEAIVAVTSPPTGDYRDVDSNIDVMEMSSSPVLHGGFADVAGRLSNENIDVMKLSSFEKDGSSWHEGNRTRAVSGSVSSVSSTWCGLPGLCGFTDEESGGGCCGMCNTEPRTTRAAFVTFNRSVTAAVACQSQVSATGSMRIRPAPEPRDVMWDTLGRPAPLRAFGRVIGWILYLLIILFWGVLTSFIGAATSTSALSSSFPIVRKLLIEYPNLVTYMNQLAPLLLIAIVAVVNPLFYLLARIEGGVSASGLERRVGDRYFVFLVVQVFVFYSVSGTVFKSLVEILQAPSKIVVTLAATVPQNSAFYIQFIVAKWFWTLTIELFRVIELTLAGLRWALHGSSLTRREKRTAYCGCFESSYPSPRNLSSTLPQVALVLFIALTYATIQPLLIPAALVFFILACIVYPAVMLAASKEHYDSGGLSWPRNFWIVVWATIISELTLSGVLFAKSKQSAMFAVWGIVGLTLFVASRIDKRFRVVITTLPIAVAGDVDRSVVDSPLMEVPVVEVVPAVWQYAQMSKGEQPAGIHAKAQGLPGHKKVVVFNYQHPIFRETENLTPEVEEEEVDGNRGYVSEDGGETETQSLMYGT